MSFANSPRAMQKMQARTSAHQAVKETRKAATMLALMTPTAVANPVKISANQPTFKPVRAVPKSPRARNQAVLDMARGQPCLLQSPLCNHNPETTVACHGAGLENGKGMGYKTGDHLSCWGCDRCNFFTDGYGGATTAQKHSVFGKGHRRQLDAWRNMLADSTVKPKDQAAAQWALDQHALTTQQKKVKNV